MLRSSARVVAGACAGIIAVGLSACNENVTRPDALATALESAFSSAPVSFAEVTSSFAGDGLSAFAGERGGRGPGRDGLDAGGIGGGFMGGGLFDAFMGGPAGNSGNGLGGGGPRGHEGGPFRSGGLDASCTFAAGTGDVTCGPTTRDGITVTRIYTFKTTAGAAQQRQDSLTNSERLRVAVSGTSTRVRRDSVTTTVSHTSDRTVTGLAFNSAQRTVNGTASGTESSSGINRDGVRFTSVRVSGDTTQGLVIPVATTGQSYPKAGTVRREMKVTMTLAGGTPATSTRREVITYNGSTTATVVITTNGTSKTCTLPLPRGKMVCP